MEKYLSEAEARQLYAGGDAAHDFDHVLRVTRLGERIARDEGADAIVVRLAALLHDVPVSESAHSEAMVNAAAARQAHHLAAADFAQTLLESRKLGTDRIANVVHSIEAHRFRDQSVQPQTLEAKCLYDADKLDSMGAIGVGRAFAYAGTHGSRLWTEAWTDAPAPARSPSGPAYTPVHEFVYKLRLLLDTLHTDSARRIGQQRHDFMVVFFDQLDAEMSGTA